MSLKSVLQKRKRKKEMDNDNIREFIYDVVGKITDEKFKESFDKLKKETEKEVSNKTNLILDKVKDGEDGKDGKGIKGDRGDKGDQGDGPTKTFLRSLIKPLIPKPKKGDKGDSIKGDKGNDGSPNTSEDIVKKLNTLNDVLDIKVLKGLKPILKSIQDSVRSVKKGGGGLGLPVHQQFTLTSATTSVTLSNNVAANGFAIWVNYQGQAVSRNDTSGYTISGKIITLGFTPQNNTYLDIIYIRS